jgi:Mannosyl-glycoprotein endo-beta-N-acetylglucosaminidase/Peptidase family M23
MKRFLSIILCFLYLFTSVAGAVDAKQYDPLDAPFYDQTDSAGGSCTPTTTTTDSTTPSVTTGVSTAVASTSGYDPLALTYPSFPDEAKIASGIEAVIQKKHPESRWLTPGFGQRLVEKSKSANVNPLFIAASGNIESGFGTSPVALAHNNSFGMKATGSTYRDFPTMEDGVFAFVDVIPKNLSGEGASGAYKNVKNIYEYFSVHQTGGIHYPGDGMDVYDAAMDVHISWDPNANASKPGNPQYNPMIYYRTNIGLINAITGLNISDSDPGKPSSNSSNCGVSGAKGSVSPTGYSFPLAPQTKAVGGIKAGQTISPHLGIEGGPDNGKFPGRAYDLFSTDSSDVYALIGGTPTGINTSYHNQQGCSSIQFHGDDGFYYWYGHLKNVVVQQGVHVDAGTKMAQIADKQNFTSECWGGTPHLHIDRGCVIDGKPQTGGNGDCRHPDFVELLSNLWSTLPGN